jgi:hypothetical protein
VVPAAFFSAARSSSSVELRRAPGVTRTTLLPTARPAAVIRTPFSPMASTRMQSASHATTPAATVISTVPAVTAASLEPGSEA